LQLSITLVVHSASIRDNYYSTKLQQQRVDDAVDQAMSSVKNGDVTGVALPLNFVLSSSNHQVTVSLRLPGVDQNQNMMIDTGMFYFYFAHSHISLS